MSKSHSGWRWHLKRYVFNLCLNEAIVDADLTSRGRVFHSLGATIAKARSPNFEVCDLS